MITAGCDIGSLTAKAVMLKDNEIISSAVVRVRPDSASSAAEVMDMALASAGIKIEDLDNSVGTGYGRKNIPFVKSIESEITCHAKGAFWFMPEARTIIDIGGQDAKAIRIDDEGNVARYIYNDKCASGTGRFLEIIADALDFDIEDLGDESLKSTEHISLSNQCVVFAETEIISLVNEGRNIADILDALHRAVSSRVASLANSISIEDRVIMTGVLRKIRECFLPFKRFLAGK